MTNRLTNLAIDIPQSLTEVVEDKIRTMIITDELQLGEQISESKLAQAFNISKTPVREALLRLSHLEGLVEIRPRSGSFVFSMTSNELDNIATLRILIEQGAIRSAMAKNQTRFLADLGKNINASRKISATGDITLYRRLDQEFHQHFFTHAENSYLYSAYRLIASKIFAMRSRINFTPEFMENSVGGHASIYDFLCKAHIEDACNLLSQHINSGFTERARRLLQEQS